MKKPEYIVLLNEIVKEVFWLIVFSETFEILSTFLSTF